LTSQEILEMALVIANEGPEMWQGIVNVSKPDIVTLGRVNK
jgi:hypothetical protein